MSEGGEEEGQGRLQGWWMGGENISHRVKSRSEVSELWETLFSLVLLQLMRKVKLARKAGLGHLPF